ncbi:MAG: carbohydrate ABC transporter permease [Anaerolineae bacterium]|nr:carbohydrate ABC transporter permease [Anaerolineae bacterium]
MKRRQSRFVTGTLQGALVLSVAAFILTPVIWLVISSVSSPKDLTSVPPRWLPFPPYLEYYRELIFGTGQAGTTLTSVTLHAFRLSLRNSLIVATGVTVVCLVLGSMAAYAFVRFRLPLGNRLVYILLLVQMLPVVVLLVPLYLTMNRLGLTDRIETVVLLLSAVHLPFVIWILRSYFQGIPAELEEAALVDGANRVQALTMVLLPLALPGLFAAGLYAFIQSWNAFMIPLIFTSSDTLRTATVAIAMFVGRHYTEYGLMSAAGVLASLPPAVLAIFFQRYLLAGLTAGAVKG